jgi:hypothetical protein
MPCCNSHVPPDDPAGHLPPVGSHDVGAMAIAGSEWTSRMRYRDSGLTWRVAAGPGTFADDGGRDSAGIRGNLAVDDCYRQPNLRQLRLDRALSRHRNYGARPSSALPLFAAFNRTVQERRSATTALKEASWNELRSPGRPRQSGNLSWPSPLAAPACSGPLSHPCRPEAEDVARPVSVQLATDGTEPDLDIPKPGGTAARAGGHGLPVDHTDRPVCASPGTSSPSCETLRP